MTSIIRGTTPTIEITFSTVDPADITSAILTVSAQKTPASAVKIVRDLESAEHGEHSLIWTLMQAETLLLPPSKNAKIECVWVTEAGVRGQSKTLTAAVLDTMVDEVLT